MPNPAQTPAYRQDRAEPPKNVQNALNGLVNALERAKRVTNVNSLFLGGPVQNSQTCSNRDKR